MLAINKEGEVFQVSFSEGSIKSLKRSKIHANRYGWPNEFLPCGDSEAGYLVCNDNLTTPFGVVSADGVLHAAYYSEREYRALEKA